MSSFKKDDEKTHTTHEDIAAAAAAAQHGFKTNGVSPYALCCCSAVDEIFPYKCQSEIIEPFSAKPHSLLRSLPCIKEA